MSMRTVMSAVVAGMLVLGLSGCDDETVAPDQLGPDNELYAKGEGGGGGNGGGGGGGSGGKGTSYSDLLIVYRDVNGVPITIGPFVGEHGTEYCVQPITSSQVPNPYYLLGDLTVEPTLPTLIHPVDGRTMTLVPLFGHYPEFLPPPEEDVHTEDQGGKGGKSSATILAAPDGKGPPVDHDDEAGGEPCDPLFITLPTGEIYSYGQFAVEVDLERLNMVRAPENVLDQHMEELALLLSTTDPMGVTLDPAGRITFDGIAIDAMPKLQGMREALLETGTIPGAETFGYPYPFQLLNPDFALWSAWQLSAFALGGAASKFAEVNVDAVVYHDRVMGIAHDSNWLGLGTFYSVELQERFVDYSAFTYDRATTLPGCATYLDPADWAAGYRVEPLLEAVDLPEPAPGATANVAAYAQMVNDVIAVILFIHEFEAVIAYADAVGMNTCEAQQALADELNGGGS